MKFSIKDFFSKYDQICSFLQIYWRNPKWKTSFFVQGNLADIKELVRKNLEQFSWCLRSTFQVLYKYLFLEAEQKGLTHLFR